eukprot:3659785-Amphidinium_carterae.1
MVLNPVNVGINTGRKLCAANPFSLNTYTTMNCTFRSQGGGSLAQELDFSLEGRRSFGMIFKVHQVARLEPCTSAEKKLSTLPRGNSSGCETPVGLDQLGSGIFLLWFPVSYAVRRGVGQIPPPLALQ